MGIRIILRVGSGAGGRVGADASGSVVAAFVEGRVGRGQKSVGLLCCKGTLVAAARARPPSEAACRRVGALALGQNVVVDNAGAYPRLRRSVRRLLAGRVRACLAVRAAYPPLVPSLRHDGRRSDAASSEVADAFDDAACRARMRRPFY